MENILRKLFPKTINKIEIGSRTDGVLHERERRYKEKYESNLFELERFIGKRVIGFPNEYTNPVVGIAKRIDFITHSQSPILVVQDYISGEEHLMFCKTFIYTEQRLRVIMENNPFDICSLIYTSEYSDTEYKKEISEERLTYHEVKEILQSKNFYGV